MRAEPVSEDEAHLRALKRYLPSLVATLPDAKARILVDTVSTLISTPGWRAAVLGDAASVLVARGERQRGIAMATEALALTGQSAGTNVGTVDFATSVAETLLRVERRDDAIRVALEAVDMLEHSQLPAERDGVVSRLVAVFDTASYGPGYERVIRATVRLRDERGLERALSAVARRPNHGPDRATGALLLLMVGRAAGEATRARYMAAVAPALTRRQLERVIREARDFDREVRNEVIAALAPILAERAHVADLLRLTGMVRSLACDVSAWTARAAVTVALRDSGYVSIARDLLRGYERWTLGHLVDAKASMAAARAFAAVGAREVARRCATLVTRMDAVPPEAVVEAMLVLDNGAGALEAAQALPLRSVGRTSAFQMLLSDLRARAGLDDRDEAVLAAARSYDPTDGFPPSIARVVACACERLAKPTEAGDFARRILEGPHRNVEAVVAMLEPAGPATTAVVVPVVIRSLDVFKGEGDRSEIAAACAAAAVRASLDDIARDLAADALVAASKVGRPAVASVLAVVGPVIASSAGAQGLLDIYDAAAKDSMFWKDFHVL